MRKLIAIGVLSLAAATAAHANGGGSAPESWLESYWTQLQGVWTNFWEAEDHENGGPWNEDGEGGGHPMAAPEIDPASALSALTLLAGGLAVIRGRRIKK